MILSLDDYRSLFKDEASYDRLVQVFEESVRKNATPFVLSRGRVIFTALSGQSVQELLADRMVKRFAGKPELLDELRRRLEEDEIVS